jgi:hypothetical protein
VKVQDLAITTDKVADAAITYPKIGADIFKTAISPSNKGITEADVSPYAKTIDTPVDMEVEEDELTGLLNILPRNLKESVILHLRGD